MPYNINPPCLAGQKTNITWQFPGQAQKSTDLGDDYDVSIFIPSNAPRVNATVSADVSYANQEGFPYSSSVPVGVHREEDTLNRIRTFPANVTRNTFTEILNVYGKPKQYRFECTVYSFATGATFKNDAIVFSGYGTTMYYASFANIIASLSSPTSNNPQINYQLSVFKNNQVVLTDTGSAQPNVTYTCGVGCPPNTCDVLCGNTICCYGSDGISVFNYPNT